MPGPLLYLSRRLPDKVMEAISERFTLTSVPQAAPPGRPDLLAGIRNAEFAICTLTEQVDEDILAAAPRLRAIANYAVGYNNIDITAARARGIVVTNTPDVLTDATADLTWALLLAAARRVVEGDRLVRGGGWSGWEPTQLLGVEVSGKTLGIVGMGRIGRAVARRADGFGMEVLYSRRTDGASRPPDAPGRQVPLADLLARSDFVSLHVPLLPDTHHLIGAAEFARMRPSAILLNTSRGPVVDEAALVEALRDGRLAGAGLDVYEREPEIQPGLREIPQVVLLPHLGSATLATRVRMGMLCVENVVAVLEDRPAPNRVA